MNDLNLGNGSQKGKQKLMIKKRELIFIKKKKKKKKRERTTCPLKDIINKMKRLQNGRKYYLQFIHLVWDLRRIYKEYLKQ